ncbi:MAG: tRNA (N6-threonylcarbamoyladenosine(37)-N6)-methyltransferase TrmO [Desulfobacteraceae bacterium]|nr:tRNA (N6-threonylcarbamoyladenosine(37)-N6)-methyltransferase TrmO [Desulfobacteraceae bacterium]
MKIEYSPIGIIRTPFTKPEGMPIQPTGAKGISGTVTIFEEFRTGLKDLDGFSHIILLYYFHRSNGYKLEIVPFLDDKPHGVFSTRAPKRPNAIGLSVVKLNKIENGILDIENIDVLDETPVLDIKPYVPDFDEQTSVRTGWMQNVQKKTVAKKKSDIRFK